MLIKHKIEAQILDAAIDYSGSDNQILPQAIVFGWKSAAQLIKKLEKID